MQVTLNIEANQLNDTVIDLFKNLNTEQKTKLASQVVSNWFTEGNMVEVLANHDRVVDELRTGAHNSRNYPDKVEYDKMSESDYKYQNKLKELTKDFKNIRATVTEEVRTKLTPLMKTQIDSWIVG